MKHSHTSEDHNQSSGSKGPHRPTDSSRGWIGGALPRAGLLLLIGVIIWAGLAQLSTPDINPSSAPDTEFSADRAFSNVEILAENSRAVGLPGHEIGRQYLIDTLASMGIDAEVQQTTSVLKFEGAESFNSGRVQNVLARLPGLDSTGAIVLNAHYDSGDTGPGAADCGACVATVLESVRALVASEPLRNDVIIVFSDAEEHGDLGAAAFTTQHPWAADARLALNYESQGVGGPAVLYATSNDNSWLVSEFLDVAPNATAYSLLPEIVSALPGQRLACDLQDYLDQGNAGLGFVYMNDSAYYHTNLDNPAEIDIGSIQQQGDYTLALVRHFGNVDLTTLERDGDAIFFNVLPGRVVAYDDLWALVFVGVATLLAGLILGFGVRRNQLTVAGVVVGAIAMVAGTVLTTLVVALVWVGTRALNMDYQVILVGSYQTWIIVVALTLLAFGCMALMYAALNARFRAIDLAAGAVVVWTLLAWVISVAAPGASYLVIWPLLFGLLPLSASLSTSRAARNPWTRMALLTGAAIPVFLLLPSTAYGIVAILNRLELMASLAGSPPLLGLWSLFVAPLASLMILHFDFLATGNPQRRWVAPILLVITAAGLLAWANATSGFSQDQPRPTHIAYELDADGGTARWLSLDPELNSWTAQFFPAEPSQEPYEFSAGFERDAFASSAPVADIAVPQAQVLSDSQNGTSRFVEIRLDSPRGGAILDVKIKGAGAIQSAEIDGRAMDLSDYPLASKGELQFTYVAIPDEGVRLVLEIESPALLSLTLRETSFGLPALPGIEVTERPADMMPAPALPLDATTVIKRYEI